MKKKLGIIIIFLICTVSYATANNVIYEQTLAARIYQRINNRIQPLNSQAEKLMMEADSLAESINSSEAYNLYSLIQTLNDDAREAWGMISPQFLGTMPAEYNFEGAIKELNAYTKMTISSFVGTTKSRRSDIMNIILSSKDSRIIGLAEKIRDLQNEFLRCFGEVASEIEGY